MTSPTALREAMARAHLDLIREGYGGQPAPDSVWAIMLHRYAQGYEDPEGAFKATDAILRAIDAAGWQVVPKEPTEDMGVSGGGEVYATLYFGNEFPDGDDRLAAQRAYRAMVAAAPRITEETTP